MGSEPTPPPSSGEPSDEPATEVSDEPQAPPSPPPVFFVDWDAAQHDFDLNLYKDRDVIGYNKDGVETRLGRSGDFTYITATGAFWGSNTVPGGIYEQIEAYRGGEVTETQVRENYLAVMTSWPKSLRMRLLSFLRSRTKSRLLNLVKKRLLSYSGKSAIMVRRGMRMLLTSGLSLIPSSTRKIVRISLCTRRQNGTLAVFA